MTRTNQCENLWSSFSYDMWSKSIFFLAHWYLQEQIILQLYTDMLTEFQIRRPVLQQGKHPIISNRFTRRERSLFLIASFVIWREQCARIFRDSDNGVTELLDQITTQWKYRSGDIWYTVTIWYRATKPVYFWQLSFYIHRESSSWPILFCVYFLLFTFQDMICNMSHVTIHS